MHPSISPTEDPSPIKISSEFSHDHLASLIEQKFCNHPFGNLTLDRHSFKSLLAEYLAMSMAFPYLQAGSCAAQVLKAIKENKPVRRETELTSVVGAFLVWDELGGWFKTSQRGARGLPDILDTRAVHANILRSDLNLLFDEEIEPHFGEHTQKYLLALFERLSDADDLMRCAIMTSFETHAERMITELWHSLHTAFGIEKKKMRYFMGHVGGPDPAEAYHVKMTESLINLIAKHQEERFIQLFVNCYDLHISWCQSICRPIEIA